MGTVDSCPFAPRSKMVISEGVGLTLGAGASALGSLLGFGSSQSANSTNIEIARMNNEAQIKMLRNQQAYNEDMWNKQNEYNLPKNQVQRLLAAGINPSAVFGSGSVSEAGQLTAPSMPALQQAHVSPYDFSGIGDAVNSYYQNQLVNAEKKRTNAEEKHTEFLTLQGSKGLNSTLKFLENQAKKEGVLGDIARSQLQYAQDSYYWNLKQLRNDVRAQDNQDRYMQEQTYNMKLQNGLQEIQLAYAPKMQESELRQYYLTAQQIKAVTALTMSNKLLTDEQKLHEIEKKTGTIIDNGMKGLDFKIKDATKKYMIGIVREQLYSAEDARWLRPFEASYKFTGNAGQWLPHATGAWAADELYRKNYHRNLFYK